METARDLFSAFLGGAVQKRPVFVPLVRGLTSRVEGLSREHLNTDPTLWANSLVKTADLLNLDGVVAGFDFTLMAEACGCEVVWKDDRPEIAASPPEISKTPEEQGRMRNALESAKRVFQVCRSQRVCFSALTGPVTLAHQVFGKEAGPSRLGEIKQTVVRVAEAFCKTRPDAVIFMEAEAFAHSQVGAVHRRVYNTLKNVASYYNIPAGLYVQGYDAQNVGQFSSLGMDIYILGPWVAPSRVLPLSDLWSLGDEALGIGIGLALDEREKAKEIIKEALQLRKSRGKGNFFFTSLGPVTREVDLEGLQELITEIRGIRL